MFLAEWKQPAIIPLHCFCISACIVHLPRATCVTPASAVTQVQNELHAAAKHTSMFGNLSYKPARPWTWNLKTLAVSRKRCLKNEVLITQKQKTSKTKAFEMAPGEIRGLTWANKRTIIHSTWEQLLTPFTEGRVLLLINRHRCWTFIPPAVWSCSVLKRFWELMMC